MTRIIFCIFLELHSISSEKKDFSQKFSFLTDSFTLVTLGTLRDHQQINRDPIPVLNINGLDQTFKLGRMKYQSYTSTFVFILYKVFKRGCIKYFKSQVNQVFRLGAVVTIRITENSPTIKILHEKYLMV